MNAGRDRYLGLGVATLLFSLVGAACSGGDVASLGLSDDVSGNWQTTEAVSDAAAEVEVMSDALTPAPPEDATVSGPTEDTSAPAAPVEDSAVTRDMSAPPGAEDAASPPARPPGPEDTSDALGDEEVSQEEEQALCGDALCEPEERCDTCPTDCPVCRPGPGQVVITEIMQNPHAVTDQHGEWIEVMNISDEALSLEGVRLRDAGDDSHLIAGPLVIAPGAYALLASSVDLGVGITADYVWTNFYLGNASDTIALEVSGELIDAVAYDGGPLWPDPTGASMALDPAAIDAGWNDDGARWCAGVIFYGAGDLGTPGVENWPCGEPPPSICGDGVCAEDELCDACAEDCGLCPCEEGSVHGCDDLCTPLSGVGNGLCQASLNCALHAFDGGDCLAPGCGSNLFFSEYVEGSSNNKALEIYNPTGTAVDLSAYAIWKITNGGLWSEDGDVTETQLEGTLLPGEVFVACHKDLASSIPSGCAFQSGGNPLNFNGDDALALVHEGSILDVVGGEGEDPGTGWAIGDTSDATKDHTLVRAPTVTSGNPLWSSALASWTVLGNDVFDGLGSHEVTLVCDPSNAPSPQAD